MRNYNFACKDFSPVIVVPMDGRETLNAVAKPGKIQTSLGRDRLEQCVFRVPVNGDVMSMCEFNANGYRDEQYRLMTSPREDHAELAEPIPRGC